MDTVSSASESGYAFGFDIVDLSVEITIWTADISKRRIVIRKVCSKEIARKRRHEVISDREGTNEENKIQGAEEIHYIDKSETYKNKNQVPHNVGSQGGLVK